MLHIGVLLAHHVHMGLEHYAGSILMPFAGGLAHHHIAALIGMHLDMMLLCEIQQILANLLLMAGGAGHFGNLVEAAPEQFRLQIFYFHGIISMFVFMIYNLSVCIWSL